MPRAVSRTCAMELKPPRESPLPAHALPRHTAVAPPAITSLGSPSGRPLHHCARSSPSLLQHAFRTRVPELAQDRPRPTHASRELFGTAHRSPVHPRLSHLSPWLYSADSADFCRWSRRLARTAHLLSARAEIALERFSRPPPRGAGVCASTCLSRASFPACGRGRGRRGRGRGRGRSRLAVRVRPRPRVLVRRAMAWVCATAVPARRRASAGAPCGGVAGAPCGGGAGVRCSGAAG